MYLYNIDDLESISEANRLQREQEAQKAEVIVAHEVEQFLHWYDTLDVVPTVKALRQQAEEIRERELAKLLGRMDHQLTEKELWSLEAMSRAIVKKLLHEPTAYLKDRPSPDKTRLARELFQPHRRYGFIGGTPIGACLRSSFPLRRGKVRMGVIV